MWEKRPPPTPMALEQLLGPASLDKALADLQVCVVVVH